MSTPPELAAAATDWVDAEIDQCGHIVARGTATCSLRPDWRGHVVTVVDGVSTALVLARAADLIASVPERHTANLRTGMHTFALPFRTPEVTASFRWRLRLDADATPRWWRGCVVDVRVRAEPISQDAGR